MARQRKHYDDMFADSDDQLFLIEAVNAQASFMNVSNPYVGNKRKMLADIGKNIYAELDFENIGTVCDLFAGSAVVGAFFKILGKKVVSNELLRSSYLNGVSLHRSNEYPISKNDWSLLLNHTNNNSDGFMEKNHEGSRLTKKEAKFIDNFHANCIELFGSPNDASYVRYAVAQSTLMQYIMSHCFVGGRLNSGQVIASLEHRLAHQRNNNNEMNFSKMEPFYFDSGKSTSTFYQGDVFDFLKSKNEKIDLFYIDPPYGGDQSDYAYMYKFFEEYLSRRNFEDIAYLKEASARFSKTKTYKESFANLLEALPKESSWVISYNNSSWADIGVIKDMVQKHKPNTVVKEIKYEYKYRSSENVTGVEYLLIGH